MASAEAGHHEPMIDAARKEATHDAGAPDGFFAGGRRVLFGY